MVNLKGKHPKTKRKLQNTEERKRERGRESFTVKLKSTLLLHHHNKPTPPTTKSKPSQKPKSKHKPPWNIYPSNPRPTTSCYPRPHNYPWPHKPNTTHIPTHPKPILREKERERGKESFVWWSVWRGLKWRNPERWEWEAKRVRWTEVRSVDWKWRKPEIWEWERRELEVERVRWRREKQI